MNVLTKEEIFRKIREQSAYLKKEYGLSKIALFGSHQRGTATEQSDLDFIIELEKPLGFKIVRLVDFLEDLFGKKVDILSPDGIKTIAHKEIIDSIVKDMEYVEA